MSCPFGRCFISSALHAFSLSCFLLCCFVNKNYLFIIVIESLDPKFSLGRYFPALSTKSLNKNTIEGSSSHIRKKFIWSKKFPFISKSTDCTPFINEKVHRFRINGWTTTVNKMRRFQERILGTSNTDMTSSTSEIWLLGTCYKASHAEASSNATHDTLADFLHDFSSRIWITYRKGFQTIVNSKLTSDVGWGCMIRSSQMLVAQALLVHHFGRAWRRPVQKPYNSEYLKILYLFGDSEDCDFSIHNLVQAGQHYGLVAGSWVGPYAMCRTWEKIAHQKGKENLPMAVYIVSGDGNGERGGAPAICIDIAAKLCYEFNNGANTWAPILLLVPLVLGLEKVNPRYIPLLRDVFKFPQSLGIMGGKPGASTYIVGIQDGKAFYLDPHDTRPVTEIKCDDLEVDTSSYHCSVVRDMLLDQVDPSLAIGFYCHDEDDFKSLCSQVSELVGRSNGAPLFTVTQSLMTTKSVDSLSCEGHEIHDESNANYSGDRDYTSEDDWQLL